MDSNIFDIKSASVWWCLYILSNYYATFEDQFMKKLTNTESELKKALLIKKHVFYIEIIVKLLFHTKVYLSFICKSSYFCFSLSIFYILFYISIFRFIIAFCKFLFINLALFISDIPFFRRCFLLKSF